MGACGAVSGLSQMSIYAVGMLHPPGVQSQVVEAFVRWRTLRKEATFQSLLQGPPGSGRGPSVLQHVGMTGPSSMLGAGHM